MARDYTDEVLQLFADMGEQLTEEQLRSATAAYRAGAEGGPDFVASATKAGLFKELFRVN